MTCADQSMIRPASPRAGFRTTVRRIASRLRRLALPVVGEVEDLNDHMMRDVGLCDGHRSEGRMRRDLGEGLPFDQLRY